MRWLRHKQAAQDFVEFGVMVAAVALVAVVGMESLSWAIRVYFGDVAPNLAPPAAIVPGSALHEDSLVLTCAGGAGPITIQVGLPVHCNVQISDTSTPVSARTTPAGSILQLVSGDSSPALTACSLGGTGDTATCAFDYTPAQAGSVSVSVNYKPTSNHQAKSSNAVNINVVSTPDLIFEFCRDVNNGTSNTVEVGHPIACQVRLKQQGQGAAGLQGETLTFTLDPASKEPAQSAWFACSADPAWSAGCSVPPSDAGWATCTTDANGRCVIIFRPLFSYLNDLAGVGPQAATIDVAFGGDATYGAVGPIRQAIDVRPAAQLRNVSATIACTFTATQRSGKQAACTLSFADVDSVPTTAPAADHYDRSPPGGAVDLHADGDGHSGMLSESCGRLQPDRWHDVSTCGFVYQSDQHENQIALDYDGEEVAPNPSFLHANLDATIVLDFEHSQAGFATRH